MEMAAAPSSEPSSLLLLLPDEVLAVILQNLAVARPHRCCVASLAAVGSCCRRLLSIASPLLYRSAVISDLDEHAAVLPAGSKRITTRSGRRGEEAGGEESPRTREIEIETEAETETCPRAPTSRCYILHASANGHDTLVCSLAQAAAAAASHLPSAGQAYLASHFLTSTDCPCRHWPSLFPATDDGRTAIDDHIRHCHRHHHHCDTDKCGMGHDHGTSDGFAAYTTPLHAASQNGRTSTVRLLLTLLSSTPPPPTASCISSSSSSSSRIEMAMTAAAAAVADPRPSSCALLPASVLLHPPALPRALDAPAPLACLCPSRHMRALMRSSAGLGRGPGSVSDPGGWPACSPLSLALAHGHDHVAKLLIAAGATWAVPITTPSPATGCPTTALHIMAANSRIGLLEWLVEEEQARAAGQRRRHRGYCDWPDDQGLFPLHYAVLADHHHPDSAARLVKALVSLGADPDPGQHTIRSLLRRIRTGRLETEAIIPSPLGREVPPRLLPAPLDISRRSPGSIWHWQNAPTAILYLHRLAHYEALESLDKAVDAANVTAHKPASPPAGMAVKSDSDTRGPGGTMAVGADDDAGGDDVGSRTRAAQAAHAVEMALRLRHLDLLEELLGRTLEVLQEDDVPTDEDEGPGLGGEWLARSGKHDCSHDGPAVAAASSRGGASLNSTARFALEHGKLLFADVLQAQVSPSSS